MKKTAARSLLVRIKDGYNRIAEDFSDTRRGKIWPDISFLLDNIKPGSKVLDVGCGNGRLFATIEDKHVDYTGIDNSEELIKIARERFKDFPNAKFLVADAIEMPFDDNSFDIVYSIAVLHHIPSYEFRKKMLSEAGRVARPGSPVIVTVWNLWQKRYYRFIVREALKKLAGKSEVDLGDCFIPWKRGAGMMRYCHAFTVRGLKRLAEAAELKVLKAAKTRKNRYKPNIYLVANKPESQRK